MKNKKDDFENAVIYLLKRMHATFIDEVKSALSSNKDSNQYLHIESLVYITLHEAGFTWDKLELHLIWENLVEEVIRRRKEILNN